MRKDIIIRIIGGILIIAPMVIFSLSDDSKIISFLWGLMVGIGVSLLSMGENTTFFGKKIFTN